MEWIYGAGFWSVCYEPTEHAATHFAYAHDISYVMLCYVMIEKLISFPVFVNK